MKCPRCQPDNETGAKLCEECAAPLARACATCGRPLSSTAKFCPECAHPTGLPTAPPPAQRFDSPESYTPKHLAETLEGERKQVTVLFADLKGSMELIADRDPKEARKLLDPVLERMMEAAHRYEGTINQVMGDGIMALFGAPLAHEYIQDGAPEGASSPLTAALPMRQTKKKTGWVYSEPYSEAKTEIPQGDAKTRRIEHVSESPGPRPPALSRPDRRLSPPAIRNKPRKSWSAASLPSPPAGSLPSERHPIF